MNIYICFYTLFILFSSCQHAYSAPFNIYENPAAFHYSSGQANANAFNNIIGPNLLGSSASNDLAQSFFNTNNFGASASHTQNQGFVFNRFGGIVGNVNAAGSQSYTFGNRKINVAYSNGFSIGPDGKPLISNGHSITVDRR